MPSSACKKKKSVKSGSRSPPRTASSSSTHVIRRDSAIVQSSTHTTLIVALAPIRPLVNLQNLHFLFFFFNDTATTEIYTLSLHDALPIYYEQMFGRERGRLAVSLDRITNALVLAGQQDRKSTRLNSSHLVISYAVFCLQKKKER